VHRYSSAPIEHHLSALSCANSTITIQVAIDSLEHECTQRALRSTERGSARSGKARETKAPESRIVGYPRPDHCYSRPYVSIRQRLFRERNEHRVQSLEDEVASQTSTIALLNRLNHALDDNVKRLTAELEQAQYTIRVLKIPTQAEPQLGRKGSTIVTENVTLALASIFSPTEHTYPCLSPWTLSLGTAASILNVIQPALHEARLLLDDLKGIERTASTLDQAEKGLMSVSSAMMAFQTIQNEIWDLLGSRLVERSRLTIVSCTQACSYVRGSLKSRPQDKLDWQVRHMVDTANQAQFAVLSEQLTSYKLNLESVTVIARL